MTAISYEMLYIIDPKIGEDEVKRLEEETKKMILDAGGEITYESNWGSRRLAYEIKKRTEGIFVNLEFNATDETPESLIVFFKTQIGALRHMILRIPKAKLLQAKIDEARRRRELAEAEKRREEEAAAALAREEAAKAREVAAIAAAAAAAAEAEKEASSSETAESGTETTPEPEAKEASEDESSS